MTIRPSAPADAELQEMFDRCSNRGRWGDDDEQGRDHRRALTRRSRPTVAVGYGQKLAGPEFEKLCAARVTLVLLAINPGSYVETIASLDEAASVARQAGWHHGRSS
jgi:hypothetical protein